MLGQFVWMKESSSGTLRSLRFSDSNSVIMQIRTLGPKNPPFPELHQKKETRQTKIQIFSFPTHWFSFTGPITRPLTYLSDPCLLPPLLGPSNLVSLSLIHHLSTQNQVLREKPSSLGQAPSLSAPIPPRTMLLSCGACIPACNYTFKSETILWRSSFLTKLPESRNMYLLLPFTAISLVQEASLD